jgi:hypothetical protein
MYDKLERGLFRSVKAKQESGTYTEACEQYALSKIHKLTWWNVSNKLLGKQRVRMVRKLNERKAARV